MSHRSTFLSSSSVNFQSHFSSRPVLFLVISLVGLLALGAPALRISTFTPDVRIVPTSSPVRAGYDAVRDQFGIGQTSPIQVVVESTTPLDTRDDTSRSPW